MKSSDLRVMTLLGLLLTAGSAYSQTVSADVSIATDIPFEFTVNKTSLPAGHYTIRSVGSAEGRTLSIRNENGKKATIVMTNRVEVSEPYGKCKLVFLRDGEKYLLSQMWLPGNRMGYELWRGEGGAEVSPKPSAVEVAASNE